MAHLNIGYRSLAKAFINLPFLALLGASAALAEPAGSQHGVNPYAPETPAAQSMPSDARPSAGDQANSKPARQSNAGTQAGAAPAARTAPETKPVRPAPSVANTVGSTPPAAKPPATPNTASQAAPTAASGSEQKSTPAEPGGKTADVKTTAPAVAKPGEPADTQPKPPAAAQSKPAQTQPGQSTAPPSDVALPGDATVPTPTRKEAATEPEPAKPAGKQILVNVDKTTQEMTVFVDGIEEHRWPVSTGTYGYTTPSGSYTASSMNEIWYSKQWDNAPMPHAIFFTKKGHAIHGSKEVKSLGTPASHGCVRLSPKNAKSLFQLVEANGLENTQVVIGGETPGGEARIASQQRERGYGEYQPWAGQGYYPPPPYGWGGRKRRGYAGAPPPGYYRAPPRRRWFQGPGVYPRY